MYPSFRTFNVIQRPNVLKIQSINDAEIRPCTFCMYRLNKLDGLVFHLESEENKIKDSGMELPTIPTANG
jgi:hypothetical protein